MVHVYALRPTEHTYAMRADRIDMRSKAFPTQTPKGSSPLPTGLNQVAAACPVFIASSMPVAANLPNHQRWKVVADIPEEGVHEGAGVQQRQRRVVKSGGTQRHNSYSNLIPQRLFFVTSDRKAGGSTAGA